MSFCRDSLFPARTGLYSLDLLFTVLSVLCGFRGDSDGKKNLPAMQETQDRSLGQEDTLEKGMATHSSVLAWRIPWTEEPGGLQSMGSQQLRKQPFCKVICDTD